MFQILLYPRNSKLTDPFCKSRIPRCKLSTDGGPSRLAFYAVEDQNWHVEDLDIWTSSSVPFALQIICPRDS